MAQMTRREQFQGWEEAKWSVERANIFRLTQGQAGYVDSLLRYPFFQQI